VISLIVAGYNTYTLTPELKIQLQKPICSFSAIKELVGSGIWSSIAIAGNTLMDSLDLLICNMYLGATEMGVLSLSKSLPSIMLTFSETIRGVFGPELTIAYAKGDKDAILSCVRRAMKITGVVITIPAAGIFVMSDAMYQLWVPSQDAKLLWILTSLAILNYIFSSGVAVLNNVFATVNKVKINSFALVITGVVSITITLFFVKFTDYAIYAVAAVSSIVRIIKNIFFMVPVTSKMLGFKWYKFYPQVGMSILSSAIIVVVGIVVRRIIFVNSWGTFFLACFIIGSIGLCINFIIVLNKEERSYLIGIIKRRIIR
jgi:O-antigen/teichoic acid export membrane protein